MKDLRESIEVMEKEGLLQRIKKEVSPHLELTYIGHLNERKKGPALLFEKVKDSDFPVLSNVISTPERVALALGLPISDSMCEVIRYYKETIEGVINGTKAVKPVEVKDSIPVTEKVLERDEVDLSDFALQFNMGDGGRYIGTAFYLITQDPDTGWTNLGVHRLQLYDDKTTGVHIITRGRHANTHMKKYQKMGKKMPAALVCGDAPINFLVASTPVPEGISEYDVIGALRDKPVEVFKSDLTGLTLPANAEIILEGEIETDPDKFRPEGPFGEFLAYYSGATTPKPYFTLKRVLRREKPIFHISTVGRPIGDTHMVMTLSRTAAFWSELENTRIPGIQSVYCPPETGGSYWIIISVKVLHQGHAKQVADAAISTPSGHTRLKGVIIVDADVKADDLSAVWWSLTARYNPLRDTELKKAPGNRMDPSLPGARTESSRIIIDATVPYEWEKKPNLIELDEQVVTKVLNQWEEYGFSKSY